MEHDFEDVEIKRNAPELLKTALKSKRVRCMIGTGSMCDPYLPIEGTEQLTRKCLQIVDECGFGFSVITKSDLILRDIDLLKSVNRKTKCVVQMTLTTFDEHLCHILEPNVCTTRRRFEVLKIMRDEGIPTVVWLSPILPFLNDTEENLHGILNDCIEAGVFGVLCFGFGVTLREGDREYFYEKLDEHLPGMKERYIRAFGNSYECLSRENSKLMKILYDECRKHGILCSQSEIFEYLHTFEDKQSGEQLELF
jgi:DNA repair photolyase